MHLDLKRRKKKKWEEEEHWIIECFNLKIMNILIHTFLLILYSILNMNMTNSILSLAWKDNWLGVNVKIRIFLDAKNIVTLPPLFTAASFNSTHYIRILWGFVCIPQTLFLGHPVYIRYTFNILGIYWNIFDIGSSLRIDLSLSRDWSRCKIN